MKLNADILFYNLSKIYTVKMSGPKTDKLSLLRPEFFMENESHLRSNHLYLASEDHLPRYPQIDKDVVLICIGDSNRLSYYKEHCCVIIIQEKCNYFNLYQSVQSIYNFYDAWNDDLFELFKGDAEIQKILEQSRGIFESSMLVIDSSFRVIAISSGNDPNYMERWHIHDNALSQSSVATFLLKSDMLFNTHEPIVFEDNGTVNLCVNLFDGNGNYTGCLCIDCLPSGYKKGMDALAKYLARIIEQCIERNPVIMASEMAAMRYILKNLIDDAPIAPKHYLMLNSFHPNEKYVCVCLRSLIPYSSAPTKYVLNIVEKHFPHSFAFARNHDVICFLNLKPFYALKGSWKESLTASITPILESLKLCAGISNDFSNLSNAKIYLYQAAAAIGNGALLHPEENCYTFSDYALMEMTINALSSHPVETYYPNGLARILSHDEDSSVDYFQTLKVFLEQNMNYAQAAKLLYIHRSTMIDRMERIKRELEIDLENPEQRLYLQLLLKAIEIQNSVKNK